MDTSTGFPESPMEQDEAVYPCKGCGEVRCPTPPCCFAAMPPPDLGRDLLTTCLYQILEEGKAFELGMFPEHDGDIARSIY